MSGLEILLAVIAGYPDAGMTPAAQSVVCRDGWRLGECRRCGRWWWVHIPTMAGQQCDPLSRSPCAC